MIVARSSSNPPWHRGGIAAGTGWLLASSLLCAQQLPVTVFDTDHGLPSSGVLTTAIDGRGVLWVGSSWGLSRLDGERFATFSVTHGLPSAVVRVILEDPEGRLWLGTNKGLARYDGRRMEAVPIEGLERGQPLAWTGVRDGGGRLWFGTEAGLVRVDQRGRAVLVPIFPLEEPDAIYALHFESPAILHIGARNGALARCALEQDGSLERCEHWPPSAIPGSGGIRDLASDSKGRLFIATRQRGVWMLDAGSLTPLARELADAASQDAYDLLVREVSGELWIGLTRGGLLVCPLADLRLCLERSTRNGLPSNQIRHLGQDEDGTVWISTDGGLARLGALPVLGFDEQDGLPDRVVLSILPDPSGSIWIGTARGPAIFRFGAHGEPSLVSRRQDPGAGVYALARDARGSVWAGTEAGLCRLRPEDLACLQDGVPEILRKAYVISLGTGPEGTLWVGTAAGLVRFHPTAEPGAAKFEVFQVEQGLASGTVYAVAVDREGRLWAAHREGLSWQVDSGGFEGWTSREQPLLSRCRTVATTGDGTVWIGGEGFVARHVGFVGRQPRFERLDLGRDLEDRAVIGILEAGPDLLLLGTNRGVLLVDRSARGGKGAVRAYWDRSSGLPGSDLAHSAALARDAAGQLWLGLHGGLARFAKVPESSQEDPPAVEFLSLETSTGRRLQAPFTAVDGTREIWLEGRPLLLASSERQIRVSVAPRHHQFHQGLGYRFRLVGVEQAWSPVSSAPERDFSRLPPGRLRLEARSVLPSGLEGPVAVLELRVLPYWWERTLVRLLAVVALALLVAAAVAWRDRVQRRRADDLARAVSERTQDLLRYARALSEHLAVVDRDLERRRKLERKETDLLSRLAHDVRSPLTSLLGFSELLASSASSRLSTREIRYLSNLTESGKQILRLVDDLLLEAQLVSEGRKLHLESIAVAPLLSSIASLLEGLGAPRGIAIELQVDPALGEVTTDLALLRQVLLNLVSNAIKYSPEKQIVEVAAGTLEAMPDRWWVEVRDRGPGIPAEEREEIFAPFRRGQQGRSAPGFGLGLAIVRELVERLDGKIELLAREGGGTNFRLVLRKTPPSGLGAQEPESIAGARPRILVFDPDPERFRRLADPLEPHGFLAVRTDEVEEARRLLRELQPMALVCVSEADMTDTWLALERLLRDLERTGAGLILVLTSASGRKGYVLEWDRLFGPGTPRSEIVEALGAASGEPLVVEGDELKLLGLPELVSSQRERSGPSCLVLPEHWGVRPRERWRRDLDLASDDLAGQLAELLDRRRARSAKRPS